MTFVKLLTFVFYEDVESQSEQDSSDGEDDDDAKVVKETLRHANSRLRTNKGTEQQKEKPSDVLYIGHLPPLFGEMELKGFLSQFGSVRDVRVSRSLKTGRSRGYAFVRMRSPEVAAIIAEALAGYILKGTRRLICHVVPNPRRNLFTVSARSKKLLALAKAGGYRPAQTRPLQKLALITKRLKQRESAKRKAFEEMGIDYDFPGYEASSDHPGKKQRPESTASERSFEEKKKDQQQIKAKKISETKDKKDINGKDEMKKDQQQVQAKNLSEIGKDEKKKNQQPQAKTYSENKDKKEKHDKGKTVNARKFNESVETDKQKTNMESMGTKGNHDSQPNNPSEGSKNTTLDKNNVKIGDAKKRTDPVESLSKHDTNKKTDDSKSPDQRNHQNAQVTPVSEKKDTKHATHRKKDAETMKRGSSVEPKGKNQNSSGTNNLAANQKSQEKASTGTSKVVESPSTKHDFKSKDAKEERVTPGKKGKGAEPEQLNRFEERTQQSKLETPKGTLSSSATDQSTSQKKSTPKAKLDTRKKPESPSEVSQSAKKSPKASTSIISNKTSGKTESPSQAATDLRQKGITMKKAKSESKVETPSHRVSQKSAVSTQPKKKRRKHGRHST